MIRRYTYDDLDQVLDAWYLASLGAHPFLDDAFFEAERRLIADEYLPASETWVYVTDERVVGSASVLGNEVGGIFVAPAHQSTGIGRALLDHVATSRPHLELEVFEANVIGRRFYDAYGFRVVASRVDDATGHPMLRLRFDRPPS